MGTTSKAGVQRVGVQSTHLGQVPQTIFYNNWPMGLMLTNSSSGTETAAQQGRPSTNCLSPMAEQTGILTAHKRAGSDLSPQENKHQALTPVDKGVFRTEDGCSGQAGVSSSTYSCPMCG